MNASKKLDLYLESFGLRLKKLTLLQGIAISAIVLLLASVIGAWFATESGYSTQTIVIARVLLILAVAAIVIKALIQPLKHLDDGLSAQVETRATEKDGQGFDGRIETYAQMKASKNPFKDLLAEDALKISEGFPVTQQIQQKELNIAGAVIAGVAAILIYLLIAGPWNLNYSLRNLFAGWAIDDLLPPQSIVVDPGDQSVRRGANLRITSTMDGFDPDEALIHVQSGDNDWQEVELVKSATGFEFTFFSLQEPMSYYISTMGVRSPEFDIQVVDVPSIEELSLTYHYPEWTEREDETFTIGDIRTLPETQVELTITTTAPLNEGALILNEQNQTLSLEGNVATTNFVVNEEGEYFIAAIVGGEEVRLSDDYFIRLTEDGKPVIEFIRPGEDYNASSIEEVLVRIEASDDYGLDNVELKYSVNGSDFASIDLSEATRELSADHIFMLEDMRSIETQEVSTEIGAFNFVIEDDLSVSSSEDAAVAEEVTEPEVETIEVPLQPGDLISYYAEASDRTQTVRTDMFFIQVQSYNRRYTQSQLSGGGGGGEGGPQDEISQRQRQIIVSTWNLIREQAEEEGNGQVALNSSLLSELQTTLAEQAQTLVERTRARQLSQDAQIESFVASMEQAVQAMYPASEKLALVDLDEAIGPAQQALQHLLRAEAVFNDITVTQQEGGGGGGGGGQASQDLAEMFELEMDIEKNQYETGSTASAQQQQQEADNIMDQLDELAKRQEQLANNMRNQDQVSEAQRFQQEILRREAEQLQEQLERQQEQQQNQSGQQQANNQSSPGEQQGEQQGQQQGGQQGQGGQGQAGEGQQGQEGEQVAQQSELQRRLDSAIRAMEESSQAMQGNLTQEERQQALEEAQRQLEGARDQVALEQLANMQESFSSMADQAQDMLRAQQRMEQTMQDAVVKAVEERESGEDPNSRGMALAEEWALAREKQEMVADLQNLQQQMLNSMQSFDDQVPEAARELQQANSELSQSELEQALSDAALYIDSGYVLYIAGNESNVTAGMRDLAESLERAQTLAQGAGASGDSEVDRARQQARDLRAQLQEQLAQAQQGGQPGQGQQQGQQPGEGEGQGEGQGSGQPGGQQAGNGGGQVGNFGNLGGAWTEGQDFYAGPIALPDDFYGNVDELTDLVRAAVTDLDLNTEELEEMYDLIRELEYSRVNRNDAIIAEEYNSMLALIEQLEVNLQIDNSDDNPNNVRTAVTDIIPEEYRDSVAEYYRRLSRE